MDRMSSLPLTHGQEQILRGRKILLVEDNVINQKVARLNLEKLGANITIADNGRIALEKLEQDIFDLIIMDIQMPEMDGFETTTQIRASGRPWKHIPIIAMTASAMNDEKERCMNMGMNWFVSKPFTREDLVAAIKKCLANYPSRITPRVL
jgi:CheY-like chemotaxis protein